VGLTGYSGELIYKCEARLWRKQIETNPFLNIPHLQKTRAESADGLPWLYPGCCSQKCMLRGGVENQT
jgi:hypothetical protein